MFDSFDILILILFSMNATNTCTRTGTCTGTGTYTCTHKVALDFDHVTLVQRIILVKVNLTTLPRSNATLFGILKNSFLAISFDRMDEFK